MTPEQVELLQHSFARVVPISETTAELFYGRLFDIPPEIRPLFNASSPDQGRKFMSMLATLVRGLKDPQTILPTAQSLGGRHVGYGVVPEQYEHMGEALLWALEHVQGDDFTPDVRAAWAEAYAIISGVMTQTTASPKARTVAA